MHRVPARHETHHLTLAGHTTVTSPAGVAVENEAVAEDGAGSDDPSSTGLHTGTDRIGHARRAWARAGGWR